MSGHLRQLIGPARARLATYLVDADNLIVELTTTVNSSTSAKLNEYITQVNAYLSKITRAVQSIEGYINRWTQLISTLDSVRAAEETATYDAFLNEGTNEILTQSAAILELLEENKSTIQSLISTKDAPTHNEVTPTSAVPILHSQYTPPVKEFSGDLTKWKEFYQSFHFSIDSLPYPPHWKMTMLLSLLRGPAYRSVAGLEISDSNYTTALELLRTRFGNEQQIQCSLHAKLNNLRPAGEDTHSQRRTLEEIEKCCRQLEALGENIENTQIALLIISKFPESIMLKLHSDHSVNEPWRVNEMRKRLEEIIAHKEEVQLFMKNLSHKRLANNDDITAKTCAAVRPPLSRVPRTTPLQTNLTRLSHLAETPQFTSFPKAHSNVSQPRNHNQTPRSPCVFCQENHWSNRCNHYTSRYARLDRLRQLNICTRCLQTGHLARDCISPKTCFYCKKQHPTALRASGARLEQTDTGSIPQIKSVQSAPMRRSSIQLRATATSRHDTRTPKSAPTKKDDSQTLVSKVTAAATDASRNQTSPLQTLLLTAIATVYNAEDANQILPHTATIFFDSGSQQSFITESFSNVLNLRPIESMQYQLSTFGSSTQEFETQLVKFEIQLESGELKPITAHTVKEILPSLRTIRAEYVPDEGERDFATGNYICTHTHPDILIGIDYLWDFLLPQQTYQLPNGFTVVQSTIGPLVCGRGDLQAANHNRSNSLLVTMPVSIDFHEEFEPKRGNRNCMQDFWDLEGIGVTEKTQEEEDRIALDHFSNTVTFKEGRYVVRWPWIHPKPPLPTNYAMSLGRLRSIYNRLRNSPVLLQRYDEIIKSQKDKGIIELAPTQPKGIVHYLPHQPVVTPEKVTTKLRIVYDASARATSRSISLNDALYRGPVILPSLVGLLLRFRFPPIVITADIEKAFLQISLAEADRDCTRFFWLKDVMKEPSKENLVIYRFARVPFGVVSSPFLLAATIRHHLKKYSTNLTDEIYENTYVDNILLTAGSHDEAIEKCVSSKEIFADASMNLREYLSNSKIVNDFITEWEQNAREHKQPRVTKVLGIRWDTEDDTIRITFPECKALFDNSAAITKRSVLHTIASLYDPLGLFQPITLRAKIYFQSLWQKQYDWNDRLSDEEAQTWRGLVHDWLESTTRLARKITVQNYTRAFELHIFADASIRAYGACAYLVSRNENGRCESHLLYVKSRLNPMKKLTVPKLELLAIYVAAQMLNFLRTELTDIKHATIWSDSISALKWVAYDSEKSRFVKNRVRYICEVDNLKLRYVSTLDNPADITTRGISIAELNKCELWWKGPRWLTNEMSWPQSSEFTPITTLQIREKKKLENPSFITISAVNSNQKWSFPVRIERFSNLSDLLIATVYVLRFLKIKILSKITSLPPQLRKIASVSTNSAVTSGDIALARWILVRASQQQYPPSSEEIRNLDLRIDDSDGLYKSFGRLKNSLLPINAINPIYLSKKSELAVLIVLDTHRNRLHSGVNDTLGEIRKQFWIPCARQFIKKILREHCFICRKHLAKPFTLPPFPSYPKERVRPSPPFTYIGVDYLGPLTVRMKNERCKVWVALFTCLSTRALHLEPVFELSTSSFLYTLRKFISRRGTPRIIYSDQATTFQSASKVLTEVWSKILSNTAARPYLTLRGIQWKFNTPHAPWQGGYYERLIGMVKNCFKRCIGRRILDFESFTVLCCETETVLNSRPLTTISSDSLDISNQVLRPIDFLIPLGSVSTPSLWIGDPESDDEEWLPAQANSVRELRLLWEKTAKALQKFWQMWSEQYLISLRERYQNYHKHARSETHRHPEEGEIVLLADKEQPRGHWRLARIKKILPSEIDNAIRSAVIELADKSTLTRTVNYLVPLELTSLATPKIIPNSDSKECKEVSKTTKEFEEHRYYLRPRKTIRDVAGSGTMKYFVLSIILCLVNAAVVKNDSNISISSFSECQITEHLRPIFVQNCVRRKFVIFKNANNSLCWSNFACPYNRTQSITPGLCEDNCDCPKWSIGCSFYNGSATKESNSQNPLLAKILAEVSPNICSFTPSPTCANETKLGEFAQIELYDGTKHLVSQLSLTYADALPNDYVCIGSGPITGTSRFCEHNICVPNATQFCWYDQAEIVYFQSESAKMAIRAWGYVYKNYYQSNQQPLELNVAASCPTCSVECTNGGVIFHLSPEIDKVEVCGQNRCYQIMDPLVREEVYFPSEVTLYNYEVNATGWSKGNLVIKRNINCNASPFCETIRCNFCLPILFNFQCTTISTRIYFLLLATFCLCIAYYLVYLFIPLILILILIVKRLCRCIQIFLKTVFKFICCFYKSADSRSNHVQGNTIKLNLKSLKFPSTRRKDLPYVSFSTAVILTLAAVQICSGCIQVASLTAREESCVEFKNNSIACNYDDTTVVTLHPNAAEICLRMTDAKNNSIGLLTLRNVMIQSLCKPRSLYFTRSYRMKVQTVKRCPETGSCVNKKCASINKTSRLEEFDYQARNFFGYTYCYESCGCWLCGCFYCSSGCLFVRTYARPRTSNIYEVLTCAEWTTRVRLEAVSLSEGKVNRHLFTLTPGHTASWEGIRLTLSSASLAPSPITSQKFLFDLKNQKMVKVSASAAGQPVTGTVGDLQCYSYAKAQKFDCRFPATNCNCQPEEETANCECTSRKLEDLFRSSARLPPCMIGGQRISNERKQIIATIQKSTAVQIQVTVKNVRVVAKSSHSECTAYPNKTEVSGCYNCEVGAKLNVRCTSTVGTSMATVICSDFIFHIRCTKDGCDNEEFIHFNRSVVDETCVLSCAASNTTLQLEGRLRYIQDNFPSHLKVSQTIKQFRNIKLPDFSLLSQIWNHFKSNIYVLIAGLAILLAAYLVVPFLKILVMMCKIHAKSA